MDNCIQQQKIVFPQCPIEDHASRLNQICLKNDCEKFFQPVCGECIDDNIHLHQQNEVSDYNLIKKILNKTYTQQNQNQNEEDKNQEDLKEIEQEWKQLAKNFKILSEKCLKVSDEINQILVSDKNQDVKNVKEFFDNNKNIQIEQLNQQLLKLKRIMQTKQYEKKYDQEFLLQNQLKLQEINLQESKFSQSALNHNKDIYEQLEKIIKNIDLNLVENFGREIIKNNTQLNLVFEDFQFIQESLEKSRKNIKVTELKYSTFKDGGDSTNFHNICRNIGPHLILIKVKNQGVIGAFVPDTNVWQNSNNWVQPQSSSNPFLFYCPQKIVCKIYQNRQHAYYDHSNYGPTFGGNHDIYIDNSLKKGQICVGHSYEKGNLNLNNQSYEYDGFEVYLLDIPKN